MRLEPDSWTVPGDEVSKASMRLYTRLLRLYPADVRYAHGSEMRLDFEDRVGISGQRGRSAAVVTPCDWSAR